MGAKIGVKVKRAKEALKGRDLASCSLPLYRITAAGNDPSKHGGGALEEEQNCGCRTFSPPISPSYSPSSPLAGEEVPHPQPGGWDLWYFLPSQGGLGNEVPHPQPGALGVGGTTSPARGPACEVLFPPLGQLWTTWSQVAQCAACGAFL